ncbi:MAG: ECF-type sigma factor [Myxococcota bacterium]
MEPSDFTLLLARAREGDDTAQDALLPLVYGELRAIAQSRVGGRRGHTLQATALVHEAYLRSLGGHQDFENRRHFLFVASRAMRDILVEHARRKSSQKRGGDTPVVPIEDDVAGAIAPPVEDMLALNDALELLEASYERPYQVVMLRFFGGLTNADAAEVLEVTPRTAQRDWEFARAFLFSKLADSTP